MFVKNRLKGRIIYVDNNKFLLARGLDVYESSFDSYVLRKKTIISTNNFFSFLYKFSLFRRLLRKGIHHYVKTIDDEVFFYDKSIYSTKHNVSIKVPGSRPLCVCSDSQGNIYYGLYHSNPDRASKSYIYKVNAHDFSQEIFSLYDNVRHIHGVFYDEYTDKIWATTGDIDDECGLWVISKDNVPSLFLGGGQQERAVSIQFTKDYIFYGTDSPLEKNCLYRVSRKNKERVKICDVSSSVFYSTKVNEKIYFSTVIEPSEVNLDNAIQIWELSDESIKVDSFKKDIFPMKLFQYGQAQFPSGVTENNLCVYLSGVKNDGYTIIYQV